MSQIIINPHEKIRIQYYPTWKGDRIKTEDVTPYKLSKLMDDPKNSDFYLVTENDYISDFTIEFLGTGRNLAATITLNKNDYGSYYQYRKNYYCQ